MIAISVKPTDSHNATRVIGSIPEYYQKNLSTVTASAKAALVAADLARAAAAGSSTSLTITSGYLHLHKSSWLMTLAKEEWDRQQALKSKSSVTSSKPKEGTGVALSVIAGNLTGGKSNTGKGRLQKGVCWNCGGKGHVKSQCPSPKPENSGRKGTTNGRNTSGTAQAVVEEDDGIWAAIECSLPSRYDLSDVRSLFDSWEMLPNLTLDADSSESEGSIADWSSDDVLDDFESLWDGSDQSDITSDLPTLVEVSDTDSDDVNPMLTAGPQDDLFSQEDVAEAVADDESPAEPIKSSVRAELYDSGCTQHMSPYRNEIQNFKSIPP